MGTDTGSFQDMIYGDMWVEASGGRVIVWMKDVPRLRLAPDEAEKLSDALLLAAACYQTVTNND